MADLPFRNASDRAATDLFFKDRPEARRLFNRLARTVATWGRVYVVASKSRVAFLANTRFAWVPEAFQDGAIYVRWMVPHAIDSQRLRSGPVGARWSHGTKVHELDPELLTWLREAFEWDEEPEDAVVLPRRKVQAPA
jgi:hypothetical protein